MFLPLLLHEAPQQRGTTLRRLLLRAGDYARVSSTMPGESALLAICLLAMTGLRKSEVLNLQWQNVDLQQGFIVLPWAKAGGRTVLLGGTVIRLLEEVYRTRESDTWVCPGRHGDKPFNNLRPVWVRLCEAAGIGDATLHTLRHSFATAGVSQQISVQIVGSLLGHRRIETSMRYSHIADDPARRAADTISSRIAGALEIGHEDTGSGES